MAKQELAKRLLAKNKLSEFVRYNYPEYDESWHHSLIMDKLEAVERGEIKKLMVFVGPRSGKSELCSKQFPAWFLGRHPEKDIITASYSSDLACDFGRSVRNLVDSPEYKRIFPEVELAQDSKSAGQWHTNHKGAYVAAGVGGAITGKGADCIAEGEMVETIYGEKPIEDIVVGDIVLSYNEGENRLEYKRVEATRKIEDREVIDLDGHLTCTADHRVYDGIGYNQAKDCKKVYKILPDTMRELRKDVRDTIYGVEKEQAEAVLFDGMFSAIRKKENISPLQSLQEATKERCENILLWLQGGTLEETGEEEVSRVWSDFYRTASEHEVLFNEMQERASLEVYPLYKQPKLATRERNERVQPVVSEAEESDNGSGRGNMQELRREGRACASSGQQQVQRQARESDNLMCFLSHYNPQEQRIRPDRIKRKGRRTVYDIQVADNKNFFANGILVHNCLIIDDPVKNREEAESETIQQRNWDWYRSTAYTRLSPTGAIIVILTRWHDNDLAGKILRGAEEEGELDEWDIVSLPAIAIEDEEYRNRGEALWPNRWPLEKLEKIKKQVGSYDWSALYQQNPLDEDSQEFKQEMFKYRSWEEVRDMNTRNFLTIDTAVSKQAAADYTAFTLNCVDDSGNWNIKAWHKKVSPLELLDMLFILWERYRLEAIGIEKTMYLQTFKPFLDEEMKKRVKFMSIRELSHGNKSKELRIRGLLPRYESGVVYHISGECGDLEEELLRFPKGVHDDCADSLAYQLQISSAPMGKMFISKADADFIKHTRQSRVNPTSLRMA